MAVRVIDEGPDPSVVKKVVCGNCGAKLEYTPVDVQRKTVGDYTGSVDVYKLIQCPKCSYAIEL